MNLEEFSEKLSNLGSKAQEVAARALYDGAGVMADAMNRSLEEIQTEEFRYAFNGKTRLPTPEEKDAIRGKIGIAKFRKNGTEVDTRIGLNGSGYATVNGKRKAVAKIAYSINSGTSFMKKQPFIRKTATKTKAAAEQAIVDRAEQLMNDMMKE